MDLLDLFGDLIAINLLFDVIDLIQLSAQNE